jgi:hypothetical protein
MAREVQSKAIDPFFTNKLIGLQAVGRVGQQSADRPWLYGD